MPENKTDISGATWDDLIETDYGLLRELAKQREDVRGDGTTEEIAAGLLASEGRPDAVPEDYQDLLNGDEPAEDDDGEPESAIERVEDDGEAESESESASGFEKASEYEPEREETFRIKASPFSTWLDYVNVVDEAKVHLDRDGLEIRAVDPANVGMVDAELDESAFASYTVDHDSLIGVNLVRLTSIINGADAHQQITVTYDSTTANLIIQYGGHEFTVSLIDPVSIREEPDVPELDLSVEATVETEEFQDAMKFSDEVSDHVEIRTDHDEMIVYAEGDTDDYKDTIEDGDDEIEIERANAEKDSSLFSLEYMKDMVDRFECDEIEVQHGSEFPIKMRGTISEDDRTVGNALYMLAPRIQTT